MTYRRKMDTATVIVLVLLILGALYMYQTSQDPRGPPCSSSSPCPSGYVCVPNMHGGSGCITKASCENITSPCPFGAKP